MMLLRCLIFVGDCLDKFKGITNSPNQFQGNKWADSRDLAKQPTETQSVISPPLGKQSLVFAMIKISMSSNSNYKKYFGEIEGLLPIPPEKWNVIEMCLWLVLCQLHSLVPVFKQHSIDGFIFPDITIEEIQACAPNQKPQVFEQLYWWIESGFDEYKKYYKDSQNQGGQFGELSEALTIDGLEKMHFQTPKKVSKPKVIRKSDYLSQGPILQLYSNNDNTPEFRIGLGMVIIRGIQQPDFSPDRSVFHYFKNTTIELKDGRFYLKDLGGKEGIFIQVTDREEIKLGSVIEMGYSTYKLVEIDGDTLKFTILIRYWPQDLGQINPFHHADTNHQIEVSISQPFIIGRMFMTTLHKLPNDNQLSKKHALIYRVGDRLYLQDLDSSNGTFIKLSQGQECEIKDGMKIKFGEFNRFTAEIINDEVEEVKVVSKCMKCESDSIDGLLFPCRHHVVCYECSQAVSECPLCHVEISRKVKLFI